MQQKANNETWRPVPNFEGLYEVSDQGRVRSVPHMTIRGIRGGRIRKQRTDAYGYQILDLFRGDRGTTCKVHRLVLSAFVGPCPEGMEACHFPDRSKSNNALSNLRWDTRSANNIDSVKHGTHGRLKFSRDDIARIFSLRESGLTHRAIAAEIGCSKPHVEKVLYGKLRAVA